jgi:hypothetical protein
LLVFVCSGRDSNIGTEFLIVSRYSCAYCIHYSWQFNVGSVPLKRFFFKTLNLLIFRCNGFFFSEISMYSLDLFVILLWILLKHIMFLFHRKFTLMNQPKPSGITYELLWNVLLHVRDPRDLFEVSLTSTNLHHTASPELVQVYFVRHLNDSRNSFMHFICIL